MAMALVRSWLGRPERLAVRDVPPKRAPRPLFESEPPPAPPPVWTEERRAVASHLWGEGYQFPGGEIEVLRLVRPLGLSGATNLLLLGGGAGGAACSLTAKTGARVCQFEADGTMKDAADALIVQNALTNRVRTETWDPANPDFPRRAFHHGVCLEPLNGRQPEPLLAALGVALKPAAHLMLTELVADTPFDPADPVVAEWAAREQRDAHQIPPEVTITRILGRLGFETRGVEDLTGRLMPQAMAGWRAATRTLDGCIGQRALMEAYEREAHLWTLRLRLFKLGRLRLVRWHAVGGGF